MDLQLQKYNHFIHFYLPATKKNIPPLKGSTLLLVSIGNEMKMSKMASKSSSKKITSALGWDFVEINSLVLSNDLPETQKEAEQFCKTSIPG